LFPIIPFSFSEKITAFAFSRKALQIVTEICRSEDKTPEEKLHGAISSSGD